MGKLNLRTKKTLITRTWKSINCITLVADLYAAVIVLMPPIWEDSTGELGYDGLNGTRKIGPSYAKSVVYI